MPDPLSIAAGVVGVTVPALHGARLLLDDLWKIADAPKAVESLKADLTSIDTALQSLQTIKDHQWELLGKPIADQSKTAISNCKTACASFHSDLRRWTRHSTEGKLSWQDRTKIGFFKERQMKAISEELQICKLSFSLVVGIATLYSSIRNTEVTEGISKKIAAQEVELAAAITAADTQMTGVKGSLTELRLSDTSPRDGYEDDDRKSAVRQLEEEVAMLKLSQRLLEALLSNAKEDMSRAANAQTQVSFGNNNSGFQVGASHGPISGISFGR